MLKLLQVKYVFVHELVDFSLFLHRIAAEDETQIEFWNGGRIK